MRPDPDAPQSPVVLTRFAIVNELKKARAKFPPVANRPDPPDKEDNAARAESARARNTTRRDHVVEFLDGFSISPGDRRKILDDLPSYLEEWD